MTMTPQTKEQLAEAQRKIANLIVEVHQIGASLALQRLKDEHHSVMEAEAYLGFASAALTFSDAQARSA